MHSSTISASRRARDSIRACCFTGRTKLPCPVTMRNCVASLSRLEPEMSSASLGAGTRQNSMVDSSSSRDRALPGCRYSPKWLGLVIYTGTGVTKTERADSDSTTTTRQCRGIGSSDHAANASLPPRTGSSTSPGPFSGMETVSRPILPSRLSSAPTDTFTGFRILTPVPVYHQSLTVHSVGPPGRHPDGQRARLDRDRERLAGGDDLAVHLAGEHDR